jgi:hypothetical protein
MLTMRTGLDVGLLLFGATYLWFTPTFVRVFRKRGLAKAR